MKNNKWIVISISMIILLVLILLFITPKIDVRYDDKVINELIEIEYGNELKYPFATSSFLNKDISNKIKMTNNIDTTKVGDYYLKYELNVFIYDIEKNIKVKVVDKIKPEIELIGNNPSDACSIQSYVEEGYKASDNYDGDITDKVTTNKKENIISYSVKDSSNNEATIEREIVVNDKIPPVIKLKGKENNYVRINDKFVDEGITISDNCDTEFNNVETINNVDTSKVGVYEIIYKVTDTSGNISQTKRYVYVYNPDTSSNLSGGEKGVIYLTFDDGPSSYTENILNVLKKYNIKATFFVTMSGKDKYIKREFEEGHTVGLHTATHEYKKVYSSVENYFKDLETVKKRVYDITGEEATIIRFPGGSSNTVSKNYKKGIMTLLTNEVLNRGYHYFDWNISIEDAGTCAKKKNEEEKEKCIFNYFKKGLNKNKSNVVLMHDIKKYTSNKIEEMIEYALSQGYTFDRITMETKQIHHKVNN